MTNDCEIARRWMLEAEPAELRAPEGSPVADHLAGCDACRQRVAAIVAGMAELDGALAELVRTPAPRRTVLRLRPAAWRWAAAPLALAAGMAAVMLARRPYPAEEPPGVTAERIARVLFAPAPVAQAVDGRRVAVLETNDPGVTVVWFY